MTDAIPAEIHCHDGANNVHLPMTIVKNIVTLHKTCKRNTI
jgi:hypothetical protein